MSPDRLREVCVVRLRLRQAQEPWILLFAFVFFVVIVCAANPVAAAFGPLTTAYSVECWGAGVPSPVPTGSQYTQLAPGDSHTCALTATNAAECWGDLNLGQGALADAGPWKWIVAGYSVSCGLRANGTASCYGLSDARTNVTKSEPYGYYGLAMQATFGCGLTQPPGVIDCWGVADHGEISNRPTDGSSMWLATGVEHACRLHTNRTVFCWGNSADGRLSPPNATLSFSEVCAGSDMTCALRDDTGQPVCWGKASSIAGTPSDQSFASLACGSTHVCGILKDNGSVLCWGDATSGALAMPAAQGRVYMQIAASKAYTCGLYASPAPSPSPAQSPPSSSTPSSFPTPSVTPALSVSPTRSASSSPAPSSSSTPSSSPAPPRPSSSASAVPVVLPLTANASASFSDTEPTIDLSASASSSSGGAATSVAVRSSLQLVQVGNTTVPALAWVATNATTANATTGKTYEAQLDDDTNVTQAFSFNGANSTAASFSGLEFVIAAGSVKWSVHFVSSSPSGTQAGITLRYRLSDLSPSPTSGNSTTKRAKLDDELAVLRRSSNTPRANMTSYYLVVPSSSPPEDPGATPTRALATVVMVVEVFDVALVDDAGFVAISHQVEVVPGSSSNSSYYELVLGFPGFNRSLAYDPSIGLGVLLGSSSGRGGGSDGTDVGLIVGVVVSISVAVVVVLAVITAAVAFTAWKKKRHQTAYDSNMVNFVDHDSDDQL